MCESVCVCMAKGDPESVSSLKRGEDTSPRSVDLLDIKSPEPAVGLGWKLPDTRVGSTHWVTCENSVIPAFAERHSIPLPGNASGSSIKDDTERALDSPPLTGSMGGSGDLFCPDDPRDDVLLDTRFWKVESGGSQITDVQGRLKSCVDFWEQELNPAPWIIDYIKTGYKLPLKTIPDSYCSANQRSALENKKFVSLALVELESNRCIERIPQKPYICSPLSVVSNSSGRQRLVINLQYLNQFLWKDI